MLKSLYLQLLVITFGFLREHVTIYQEGPFCPKESYAKELVMAILFLNGEFFMHRMAEKLNVALQRTICEEFVHAKDKMQLIFMYRIWILQSIFLELRRLSYQWFSKGLYKYGKYPQITIKIHTYTKI